MIKQPHTIKKLILGYILGLAVIAGIAYANTNTPQPQVGLVWYTASDPTGGTGVSAPLWQFLVRTDNHSLYYKSGTASTAWTLISGGGGGGGTVTSITCTANEGLLCTPSPITGAGTIGIAQLVTIQSEQINTETAAELDNYDPWSGGPHTTRVEVDPTQAKLLITGIVAGNDGDLLWLWNGGNGGTNPNWITLPSQSASSSGANRFWIADGKLVNIPNNDGVLLIYDGSFGWTCFQCATSIVRAQELSLDPAAIPSALSPGTYNDYNPFGAGTTSYIRQDVSGVGIAEITGIIAAGAPNSEGRLLVIENSSTSGGVITIDNDSSSSSISNRILTPTGESITLSAQQSATLIYDDSVAIWRTASYTGQSSGGVISGTLTGSSPVDNWSPTGLYNASGINIISGATYAICGIDSSAAFDGQVIKITNFAGGAILFLDQCGSSSALNQFYTQFATTRQIDNFGAILFEFISGKGWVELTESSQTENSKSFIGPVTFTSSLIADFHLLSDGVGTTLSCNGTGSTTCDSASCNDISGTVTPNSGATACTITFGTSYATDPSCTVSMGQSTPNFAYISSLAPTAITIGFTACAGACTAHYICTGH